MAGPSMSASWTRCSTSASRTAWVLPPVTVISTRGWSFRNPAMRRGSRYWPMVWEAAMARRPADSPAVAATASRALFGERGEFIRVGKQGFAGRGEGDPAAAAVEEGNGELRFEGLDLLGDGGLGEQEFFGGLAEVQVASDGAEDAEAEIFHSDQSTESLYPPPKSLEKKWPMPWKNPPCFFAGGFVSWRGSRGCRRGLGGHVGRRRGRRCVALVDERDGDLGVGLSSGNGWGGGGGGAGRGLRFGRGERRCRPVWRMGRRQVSPLRAWRVDSHRVRFRCRRRR